MVDSSIDLVKFEKCRVDRFEENGSLAATRMIALNLGCCVCTD